MPFFHRRPPPQLHPDTIRRLHRIFPEEEWREAEDLVFSGCGAARTLGCSDGDLERVRIAALKLSAGNVVDLLNATRLARTDYRDLLMAAGFGFDVRAHLTWEP